MSSVVKGKFDGVRREPSKVWLQGLIVRRDRVDVPGMNHVPEMLVDRVPWNRVIHTRLDDWVQRL